MKQIQLTIPDNNIPDGLTLLLEKEKSTSYINKIHSGNYFIIILRTTDARAVEILRECGELNISSNFGGQIDVLSLDVSYPLVPEDSEKQPVEVVYRSIAAGNTLSADFISYVIIASIIAGAGLATNNPTAVLAAMLVSPLMGPILAFSLAPLVRDRQMAISGLKNEAIALGMCLGMGLILGFGFLAFGPYYNWPTPEMVSRGDAAGLIIGIIIAVPSGCGVALAVTTGGVNSLVGVAISVSLLPPAVNCGMLLVYGIFGPMLYEGIDGSYILRMSAISLCLVLVNISCIFVSAVLFFKIKEITPFQSAPILYSNFYRPRLNETSQQLYHLEKLL